MSSEPAVSLPWVIFANELSACSFLVAHCGSNEFWLVLNFKANVQKCGFYLYSDLYQDIRAHSSWRGQIGFIFKLRNLELAHVSGDIATIIVFFLGLCLPALDLIHMLPLASEDDTDSETVTPEMVQAPWQL